MRIAALLLVPVAAAAAPPVSVERTEQVAPGKILEWCADLDKGQRVNWRFRASAALDFNIHAHQGDTVVTPVKLKAQRRVGKKRFVASETTGWCWMWTNTGKAAVDVSYSVEVVAPR